MASAMKSAMNRMNAFGPTTSQTFGNTGAIHTSSHAHDSLASSLGVAVRAAANLLRRLSMNARNENAFAG